VTTVENGVPHPLEDIGDAASDNSRLETADADTHNHHTLTGTEAKRSPDRPPRKKPPEGMSPTRTACPDAQPNGQRRCPFSRGPCHGQQHGQGLARHALARVSHRRFTLFLSPQTKYPMQRGTLSTHGAPRCARSQTGSIDHVDTHTVARVAANPRLAHSEAALPPSLLACATCVPRPPSNPAVAQQHGQEPARHTWARVPHRRRHHHHLLSPKRPPTTGSGNIAASPGHAHREAVERILRHFPCTHDPRFAHAEVSSPQKGHLNVTVVDRRATSGVRPPSLRVGTSQ
jgi:hypothetical protein